MHTRNAFSCWHLPATNKTNGFKLTRIEKVKDAEEHILGQLGPIRHLQLWVSIHISQLSPIKNLQLSLSGHLGKILYWSRITSEWILFLYATFATNNSYLQTMNHSWWNTQLLFHAFGFKTLWPSSDVNTCPNHITSCQPADSHVQNLCLCSQRKAACPYVERGKSRQLSLVFFLWNPTLLGTLFWEQNCFFPPNKLCRGLQPPPPVIRAMPDRNHFFSQDNVPYLNKPCHVLQKCGFRLVFAMHIAYLTLNLHYGLPWSLGQWKVTVKVSTGMGHCPILSALSAQRG